MPMAGLHPQPPTSHVTSHSSSPSLGCSFWWKPTSIPLSHPRHPARWDQHSDGNQAEDFQSCTQRGYKREPTATDLGGEEETSAKSQWKSRQTHTPGSRAAAQLGSVTEVRNFLLEGTQQEPASSAGHAGHCPQTVPGTATKNSHPHWDLPGPACPSLANPLPGTASCQDLLPACSRSAPCPAPTGIFSDHPTTLPWGWSHASSTQLMSNTRGAGSLPPNYNSVSMEAGPKACSPRGEVSFFHHFARKQPTSA